MVGKRTDRVVFRAGATALALFFLMALSWAAEKGDELLKEGKEPAGEGGVKWTHYDRPDEEGRIYYGTGHMTGAAGIGTFLLKLHAVRRCKEERLIPFADKPRAAAVTKGKKEQQKGGRGSYVVLTNLKKSDPYFKAASRLQALHKGELVFFKPGKSASLSRKLRRLDARYVALVLKPEDIDVNLHRQMIRISTEMDRDPFCDFAFGFVTGATAKDAMTMVERSIRMEKRGLPRSLVSASVASGIQSTVYRNTASRLEKELGFQGDSIYWSCVESDPDVLDFVKKHIEEIQGKGVVVMCGCGDPEGIWLFSDRRNMDREKHWPFDPARVGHDPKGEMPRITPDYFKRLDLGGAVVWSGTCHSGCLRRVFVEGDIVSTFGRVDKVTEYFIPKGRSLALAILATGPSAFMAPIGANHGYACIPEQYRAMASGLCLGDVMRSRYNEIIFSTGGSLEIKLFEPGARRMDEDPMRGGGLNRTLFGDPMYRPFKGAGRDYLEQEVVPIDGKAGKGLQVKVKVIDTESGFFWDMFGDNREMDERIYTTVALPESEGLGSVARISARGEAPDGETLKLSQPTCMIEHVDGEGVIHLQVNAKRGALKRDGVVVTFTLVFGK